MEEDNKVESETDSLDTDKPIVYSGQSNKGRGGHGDYLNRMNSLRASFIKADNEEREQIIEIVLKEFDFRNKNGQKLTEYQIKRKIKASLLDRRLDHNPPSKQDLTKLFSDEDDNGNTSVQSDKESLKIEKPIVYAGQSNRGRAGHEAYFRRMNDLRAKFIKANNVDRDQIVDMVSKEFDFRKKNGKKLTEHQIKRKLNASLLDRRLLQRPQKEQNRLLFSADCSTPDGKETSRDPVPTSLANSRQLQTLQPASASASNVQADVEESGRAPIANALANSSRGTTRSRRETVLKISASRMDSSSDPDEGKVSVESHTEYSKNGRPIVYSGQSNRGRAGHEDYFCRMNELRPNFIKADKAKRFEILETVIKQFDFRNEDGKKMTEQQIKRKIYMSLLDKRFSKKGLSKQGQSKPDTEAGSFMKSNRTSCLNLPEKRKPENDGTVLSKDNKSIYDDPNGMKCMRNNDETLKDQPGAKRPAKRRDDDKDGNNALQDKQVVEPSSDKKLQSQPNFQAQKKSSCMDDSNASDKKETADQYLARRVIPPAITTQDSVAGSLGRQEAPQSLSDALMHNNETPSLATGSLVETMQSNVSRSATVQTDLAVPTGVSIVDASANVSDAKRSQHETLPKLSASSTNFSSASSSNRGTAMTSVESDMACSSKPIVYAGISNQGIAGHREFLNRIRGVRSIFIKANKAERYHIIETLTNEFDFRTENGEKLTDQQAKRKIYLFLRRLSQKEPSKRGRPKAVKQSKSPRSNKGSSDPDFAVKRKPNNKTGLSAQICPANKSSITEAPQAVVDHKEVKTISTSTEDVPPASVQASRDNRESRDKRERKFPWYRDFQKHQSTLVKKNKKLRSEYNHVFSEKEVEQNLVRQYKDWYHESPVFTKGSTSNNKINFDEDEPPAEFKHFPMIRPPKDPSADSSYCPYKCHAIHGLYLSRLNIQNQELKTDITTLKIELSGLKQKSASYKALFEQLKKL